MPVPRETGYPDYSMDGTTRYIPLLFSGKTLEKFYDACVATNISNTDYEGEIRNKGDRVIFRTIPNITIRNYKKGGTLVLEYPESPSVEFSINRAKYYNFAMDDIDIKQVDMNYLDKFADDASQQLKKVYDQEFLGTIYTQVDIDNQGDAAGRISKNINLGKSGAPLLINKGNILDVIVDCGIVLDEQNVPEDGRFIVLPPAFAGLIKKSDLRNASITGDSKSVLRSGLIGMIDRFEIYVSNLLTKNAQDGAYYCPFGSKKACIFAMQLTKNEFYRPQNTFADAMKGLAVYDFKVLYPKLLGCLYAKIGTP